MMGILRAIADRFDPPEERGFLSSTDDALARWLGGIEVAGGQLVNAKTAEGLSTVVACVNAVSTAIASLPANVFRRMENGREVDEGHPLMRIIRRGPNQHQSWPDFVEWLVASTLLRGNGLAEIVRGSDGRLVGLLPVAWEHASVLLLPNGRLAYDVSEFRSTVGGTGGTRRLLQDEVLHLRDRTDDGLIGRSRLQRAAQVVAAGLGIQEFTAAMWANGANPSGALEVDGKLGPEALERLASQFRAAFSGSANAAKALVLDQGVKWKPVSVSPEDAELLASRRFTVEELARIYGCPPPIIGDLSNGTFTNTETVGRWFAQNTLTPWITKLERALERSVLTEAVRRTHEVEIDLSGFMRGDPETRWRSHEIAVTNGILTANEVRAVEGWNPRSGGDELARAGTNGATVA